jgi:protein-S-isoprenylcysteine O-methyltransferase Ste14
MNIRILKTLGLIAGALAVVALANPTPLSLAAGGVLVLAGEALRIWAAGHLQRNREVTTSGPYAYVRDPLYLGRLLILVGVCVMAWAKALWLLPVGLAIFFANYMPRKYLKEMTALEQRFGPEYRDYAQQVHSLMPRLTRYAQARQRPWSFELAWSENREQYLLLAVLALAAAIVLRAPV